MRIISGSARGRKLVAPPAKDNSIRPTADRAREALFSILGQRVQNAAVLDLFAGTGALGLEAFSRGASRIVLVDKGHTSLTVLKKNISIFPDIHLENREIIIIKDDLQRPTFVKKLPESVDPRFDLILADPPYGKNLSLPVLSYICAQNLLKENGLLVIEERQNIVLPETLSYLELTERRTYGETSFSFYKFIKTVSTPDNNQTISPGTNLKGVAL